MVFKRRRRARAKNGNGKVQDKVKKYVRNVLHKARENKIFNRSDIALAGAADANSTGTTRCLSLIGTGSTETTRIGMRIKPVKLIVKIVWDAFIVGGAISPTVVRAILFMDKKNTQTAPTTAQVLQNISGAEAPLSAYTNLQQIAGKRFNILGDKMLCLDVGQGFLRPMTFNISAKRLPQISFAGSVAATGDMSTNSVWLLLISDRVTATAPGFVMYAHMEFEDA